jgi:T5SS/PEP-CTERM-associated repeat protein
MKSQDLSSPWSLALFVGTLVSLLAPPVAADVIESYWLTEGGDFDDPINWSGPVPDETVTAVFDLPLELGPFIMFRADEVSDRVVIRAGHVSFMMWDTDNEGEHVSRAIEVMNSNIATPSIVVAETPGVDASLNIGEGFVTTQSMVIGQGAGSSATVDFSSQLFDLTAGLACELQLHVGGGGDGLLVINQDILVTTDVVTLGVDEGSHGEIVVTDPGSSLDATGKLTVGLGGSGVISIDNEADVVSSLAMIGQQPGSSGDVTVSGLGATWTINGTLDVGFQGQGALTITDGVVLTDGFAVIGSFPEPDPEPTTGGTGVVTISGPTAFWGINGDLHVALLWEGSLNVLDGAAVTSHNGYIGLEQNPVGQVTLQGPGSAWSNIGGLSVAGTLHVSDGAIVIADALDILSGSILEGDGTIRATTTSAGVIHPGNPVGALTIEGGFYTGGELQMEIASADANDFDTVSVVGDAVTGGALTVTALGGYEPQFGDTFDILTADTVSGGFSATALPDLPPPLIWHVLHDDVSVTLLVSKLGDINGDGIVDVTDFLALLGRWGPCPDPPEPSPADLDGDGTVGINDLLILLTNWG